MFVTLLRVKRIGRDDATMKGLSIGLRLGRCEIASSTANHNHTVPQHNVLTLGATHCYRLFKLLITCAITLRQGHGLDLCLLAWELMAQSVFSVYSRSQPNVPQIAPPPVHFIDSFDTMGEKRSVGFLSTVNIYV